VKLHLITGVTGAGKTGESIRLAAELRAPVVVIDRFQCFPELATTSGRPTTAELAGTQRVYLDDRRVSDGELAAGEAFTRLRRLLRALGTSHHTVILEGGSISLLSSMKASGMLDSGVSVRLMARDTEDLAYVAAVHARVTNMLTIGPTMMDELAHAWRFRVQRSFVASICGLDVILAWSRTRNRPVQGYVHTPDDIAELTEATTTAHLDYARRQMKCLSELGFTDDLITTW
jgi:adenylate dimethylallyltransferase